MSEEKKVPYIKIIEGFLNEIFDFKRNIINQRVEYSLKGKNEYQEINIDTVFRMLQHNNHYIKLDELRSLFKSNFVKDYNPMQEYFDGLPKWDGQTDHIQILSSHIKAEDQEFFDEMFKKALVRSLACSLGGIVNRIVMVFVSKQELGESWFLRKLNPFGDKYYSEDAIRDDKDTFFRFAETFMYNLEELASLNIKEINKLKAIISMATVNERKPYAVDSIILPRRCNFWGSTNQPEFLVDVENTRWCPIAITDIDKSYSETTDYNKVWAQAYTLYKQGFDYNLTVGERKKRDRINKKYEISYPERDIVAMYLEPCEKDTKHSIFMNHMQILNCLTEATTLKLDEDRQSLNPVKINSYALTRALTALGFKRDIKRIGKLQVRGYYVIPRNMGKYTEDKPDVQALFDDSVLVNNNEGDNTNIGGVIDDLFPNL